MDEHFPWLRRAVLLTGGKTRLAVDTAVTALLENDTGAAARVRELERLVDSMYHGINEYCLETLASRQFGRQEINVITCSLKIAIELERISDYANQIAKLVQRKLSCQDTSLLRNVRTLTGDMSRQTLTMLEQSLASYETDDCQMASRVIVADAAVNKRNKELFREMLCVLSVNPWVQEVVMDYHVAIRYIERAADRTTNISELVHYMTEGKSRKKLLYSEDIWHD